MLKRVLIANRGEIAMRIIRAAKQLDIETVLVYSTEDSDSRVISFADKAVCIGPPSAAKSYLNQESIIQTALSYECDAIHPGYGFLSENAEFAEKCVDHGIIFIGPDPETIKLMGDKQRARVLAKKAGVPTVPGSDGLISDPEEAKMIAGQVGYPVLLKASAGGGGKGMRTAFSENDIEAAMNAASAEAAGSFGNGDLYLEKLVIRPRHVEVQVLGDNYGHIIHLGERDCSIQRRNQKMIEEAPAYGLDEETRKKIHNAALDVAAAAGYKSAGTVEFVLDNSGNFYFIEMNTRIQVEHPVTEMITGVDIVRQQLLIASGEKLLIDQHAIDIDGAAIECRINAEDTEHNFRPTPGTITELQLPGGMGIRVDTALCRGARVSPWYDSMIIKLIVCAKTRDEVIRKMKTALDEVIIEGVPTNIALFRHIMSNKDYILGNIDTTFVDAVLKDMKKKKTRFHDFCEQ